MWGNSLTLGTKVTLRNIILHNSCTHLDIFQTFRQIFVAGVPIRQLEVE